MLEQIIFSEMRYFSKNDWGGEKYCHHFVTKEPTPFQRKRLYRRLWTTYHDGGGPVISPHR